MFGRDSKYQETVAEAREAAKVMQSEVIVFQRGKEYGWNITLDYSLLLQLSNKPVIKLLVCLPDGTVAQ